MSSYIFRGVIFALGLIGTYLMIPLFKNMLVDNNVIRPNYKGENIPVSMGIVFLPMIIINGIILAFFTVDAISMLCLFLFIFGMICMFFAGILDDIIGNRDVSGLKGHFKSLFKG
ncbi:MAG: glycosyl transferase, partial [Terrisporobacter sp.]